MLARHPKARENTAQLGEKTTAEHNALNALRRIENNKSASEKSDSAAQVAAGTEARDLNLKVLLNERLAQILLMLVSMGIVLLTYAGVSIPLSESGGGFIDKGHALSFSVMVGVLAWLGWQFIFSMIHWFRGKRLLTGLIAGGLYVLSITAIDAPFSVLALGGPTAVQLSLVDTATFNETRVAFEFEKATKAAQLVPALRTQEGRFAGLAQREVESGSQSGRKGAGKVSEGFLQVATVLGGLADGLEAGRTKTEGLQPQLTAALAQLKRHVYTQGDIRDRSQAVSVAADKIDELLGQVQGYNYTASITATLAVLESLFPKQTSGKDEFQATQNAELAIIGEMAKPIAEALRGALAGQKVDTTPPGVMRPRGAMEAIRVYWRDLLPQWVASIFLDLSPALLLVLLLAGRREVVALQQDAKKGTSK